MSWVVSHQDSEKYAGLAEEAFRAHDTERATELYRRAAEAETRALAELDPSKPRTLGITMASAASLWYKCQDFRQAKLIAGRGLANETLPSFATEQLQTILQQIWSEESQTKSGVAFVGGQVLVGVSGGAVVVGGAPLDLIQRKMDEVSRLFYRTIELLLKQPLRIRGAPSQDIQEQFRPWLFQAAATSYQFALRIERPRQLSLFPDASPQVDQVTSTFLDIVRASANESDKALSVIVPDEAYRETFVKLTRNLAPTGKTFDRLEIKSPSHSASAPVILSARSREIINSTLREKRHVLEASVEDRTEVQLHGVLRGLQLDGDWLEVNVDGEGPKPIRISGAGEVIDDMVGPMVNHRVIVTAVRRPNGRFEYRDLQPEE